MQQQQQQQQQQADRLLDHTDPHMPVHRLKTDNTPSLSLLFQRTLNDAELAASAAQASNQPLTRALRSQLGYSLPTAEALPDDLYSRNHSKKAQQAASDPHSLLTSPSNKQHSGRAAHVKHEAHDSTASTPSSHQQQQLLLVTLQVDATGSVTVQLTAAAAQQREEEEGREGREEAKEADEEMAVKKEEEGAEEGERGVKVSFEDEDEEEEAEQDGEDEEEEKKEAEDDEAEKADEDMDVEAEAEAEEDKDDEDDEADDDEKEEQAEAEAEAETKQPPDSPPQSPSSSSESEFDVDEPSPSSSRPLALPPSDEPSLPSLLPLPTAASASSMATPSPLLAVKDDDEVMRDMDAHAWVDEHAGSGEAALGQHELPAGEVVGDEHAAGMTDDMQ